MDAILGTMTFGQQVDLAEARAMLNIFQESGYRQIDTAHIYADGKSEEFLGELLEPAQRGWFRLATKVNPLQGGGLSRKGLTRQLEISLKRLRSDCVDLLYLHQPDHETPLEETLAVCHELRQQGKFLKLGLSNYAAWQVADIQHRWSGFGCGRLGIYQGRYNALTRDVEAELFPALRHLQIPFSVYNPLAGGLLTGKHRDRSRIPETGRFHVFSMYRGRYWKDCYFDALQLLDRQCAELGLSMTQVAFRFLRHHSALQSEAGDGIILGASSAAHLQDNLQALQAGPLPENMLETLEQAWALTRFNCPQYFR